MIRRLALAAIAAASLLPGSEAAAAGLPAPAHEIARLIVETPVRAAADAAAPLRGTIGSIRPKTKEQTALPVLRHARDLRGGDWLLVRIPGRPAGRVGWIAASYARITGSHWRVAINRGLRLASVWRGSRLYGRFPVVVGKPSTPTPAGHFFVVEHVAQSPGSALGPVALAISAFSYVLQEYDGGPGQIALHGRAGALARDPLGSAASHGCVRFDNAVIRRLASLLPNGTAVDIF